MRRIINRLLIIMLGILGVTSCTKYEPDMYGCLPTDYDDTAVTDTMAIDSITLVNIINNTEN